MTMYPEKSFYKPTRVDETGKILGWDPVKKTKCLEFGMPNFILPKPAGAADAGVKWLWPDRIPKGRVTVVEGPPGVGKTYLASYQVAILVLIQSPVKYDKEDNLKKDPRPHRQPRWPPPR